MRQNNRGILVALFFSAIFNDLRQCQCVTDSENLGVVLSIEPRPQDAGTSDSLIRYKSIDAKDYGRWVTSLKAFLNVYRLPGIVPGRIQGIYNCDYDLPPAPRMVCDIDVRHWYPCTAENHFGYQRASPCVYLKLDAPPGWMPEFYNDTSSLPVEMPANLKSYIKNLAKENVRQLNTVWVSCEGENPADVEFIGPIQFIPRQGFPGYYFFNNDLDGYLSPVVALSFERPINGVLISIKCKAWARNIDHNNDSQGVGQFGLLID